MSLTFNKSSMNFKIGKEFLAHATLVSIGFAQMWGQLYIKKI